ncbi:MAG: hypothetical protein ABNH02_12380 [Pseudomonadales bacterium]|jgi:hypothetical protein
MTHYLVGKLKVSADACQITTTNNGFRLKGRRLLPISEDAIFIRSVNDPNAVELLVKRSWVDLTDLLQRHSFWVLNEKLEPSLKILIQVLVQGYDDPKKALTSIFSSPTLLSQITSMWARRPLHGPTYDDFSGTPFNNLARRTFQRIRANSPLLAISPTHQLENWLIERKSTLSELDDWLRSISRKDLQTAYYLRLLVNTEQFGQFDRESRGKWRQVQPRQTSFSYE